MPVPSPVIQYRNINPFRARCGSKFALQTPQLLPAALADILPCEICVYPKEPAAIDPTECLSQYMEETGRTSPWLSVMTVQFTESTVPGIPSNTIIPLNWQPAQDGTCSSVPCCEHNFFIPEDSYIWSTRTPGTSLDDEWLNQEFPEVSGCDAAGGGGAETGVRLGAAVYCYRIDDGGGNYHSALVLVVAFMKIGECSASAYEFRFDGESPPGAASAIFKILTPSSSRVDQTISGSVVCEIGGSVIGTFSLRISE